MSHLFFNLFEFGYPFFDRYEIENNDAPTCKTGRYKKETTMNKPLTTQQQAVQKQTQ
ncbi:hypothetical protein SAMN06297358_2385 [Pedobacter xixiisoli]|uniref:Uncharacterized protein n=1 Tax=Pedobacter xixiisoli TaxID=1476464 RepID=A0A286A0G2_9SPHI|nr:hypothetical protein SAMN06297358_2385 [Pedobacter xixiisoli]